VDHDAATFGIRSIRVDPDKGFFLIGEHVKIMGTCNHQGHAGVGIAVPDAIHVERVAALIFVNGVSAGVKSPRRNCPMYWRVIHAPSAIEARGMRQGKVVLVARRETSGTAAQPALLPSKAALRGNGEDVVSRRGGGARRTGTHRPTAFNTIHSSLSAPGKIIGVGNGDPASHEADRPASPTSAERSAFSEQCIVFVQAAKQAGIIELRASGAGLTPTVVKIVSTAETPRPAAA